MRALGEPDAFPSSDLGLLRGLALEAPRELEQRAQAWRPWRAYAAMYLWRIAGEGVPAERKLLRKNQKENVGSTALRPERLLVV
jgi:3-methyladenine DNA glycosylase/8-oxoguanine DNA glycosylase